MVVHNIKVQELLTILEDISCRGIRYVDMTLDTSEGKNIIIIHPTKLQEPPLQIQTDL